MPDTSFRPLEKRLTVSRQWLPHPLQRRVTDTYKLYATFDNIAGLTVRAKVTMAGVTIGKVTA